MRAALRSSGWRARARTEQVQPRGREGQERTKTFAARADQMRGDLRDARRVLARHARGDQRVHRLHVLGERGLKGFDRRRRACGYVHVAWLSTAVPEAANLRGMKEILRTTDPTAIAFSTALLRGEDIDCFVMDVHMSVLEGGIGIFPRRLMVADRDAFRARAILNDNDVEDVVQR